MSLGDGAALAATQVNDKLAHCLAFVYLGFALQLAHLRLPALLAGLALLAYGGAIELIQGALPYRHAEWNDLVADALGIAVALLLYRLIGDRVLRVLGVR